MQQNVLERRSKNPEALEEKINKRKELFMFFGKICVDEKLDEK